MIKVCDRTLSVLDCSRADKADLLRFLELLIETGVDGIELSEKSYARLAPLYQFPGYSLRVDDPDTAFGCHGATGCSDDLGRTGGPGCSDAAGRAAGPGRPDIPDYRDIAEFVCPGGSGSANPRIRAEICFDTLPEPKILVSYYNSSKLRICGLDGSINGDYLALFGNLKSLFGGDLQFCPGDRFHIATALAVEWAGGRRDVSIVTAFGGSGGLAATEELLMAFKLARLRNAGKEYPFFPEMAELLERISGIPVGENKAVIGKGIFAVQSGVHVDGILKQPECYEPFAPRTVGQERRILLGKQSGRAGVKAKLAELGMGGCEGLIPQILARVKQAGYQNNGEVTDGEFSAIVGDCLACLPDAGWGEDSWPDKGCCSALTEPPSGGTARMRAGERTAGDANGAAVLWRNRPDAGWGKDRLKDNDAAAKIPLG